MLILPKKQMLAKHIEARKALGEQFNKQMEKILLENTKHDKYWILGKVKFPKEHGGKIGRVFLEACLEKPPLITDAFLYEVDNRRGCKTLLWTMSPGGILRLPTMNKTIHLKTGV